jgi:hypothetical protein
MRFMTSEANLEKSGLITVYDVKIRGLRRFNISTLIGRSVMVPGAAYLDHSSRSGAAQTRWSAKSGWCAPRGRGGFFSEAREPSATPSR